jgi:hypothetical protein
MDKNSKILFAVFFLAVFISAGISFYKYYGLKDFEILAETNCDPGKEVCFVRDCYPASDYGCTEENSFSVYCKLIKKNASLIQDCDPKNPGCAALGCKGSKGCTEIMCNEEALEINYNSCSNPEAYMQNLNQ